VIETADHYMGYTSFRKRGESASCDIDIQAGGGHAGWPVVMQYGDSDTLVNGAVKNGEWGFYHELGHTYQDSFDKVYGIAPHAEIDVNLVPGLLYTFVHDRTSWDGSAHSSYGGAERQSKRALFLQRAPLDQTWQYAGSDGATGYDFYFNLAEAFGWDTYRFALGRMLSWYTGGDDADLSNLGSRTDRSGPSLRDRFYLVFCDATGRNLDVYFQRYGLGVSGLGSRVSG